MDIQTATDRQLVAFALGLSGSAANEAYEQLFPKQGTLFAMDSSTEDHLARLKAALEIDRRRAQIELTNANDPKGAVALVQRIIGPQEYESFWCIYLDSQHRVITAEEAFRGTVGQTSVYPRELVKRALQVNASSLIVAHNHPSGGLIPSRADELLTKSLKNALGSIDVRLLDHFILCNTGSYSFAKHGLL
ncbi:MAG: hypothetical protein KGZ70_13015 [Hydrogenophaga sp.]|nr:hypothetical protein [Hydrogenophaga sp.]